MCCGIWNYFFVYDSSFGVRWEVNISFGYSMNKKERVQAALLSKNLDRPPISLWMNYPEVDQEPLSLAKAHIAFQEKFDLDFIKLTPFDLYSVQDWGCQIQFFCQQDQNPTIYKYAINNITATRLVVERYGDKDLWKYLSMDSSCL